jgi:DNA-binding NarL/FixJ family response regulator
MDLNNEATKSKFKNCTIANIEYYQKKYNQYLSLKTSGKTDKDIAEQLNVSERTLYRIINKMR